MRILPSAAMRRPAHTMVEVLVVVFIISMLVGLTFVLMAPSYRFVDDLEKQVAKINKDPKFSKVLVGQQGPLFTDRYLVLFKDSVADPKAEADRIAQAGQVDIQVIMTMTQLVKVAVVKTTEAGLMAIKNDAAVKCLEQETRIYAMPQVTPTGVKRMNLRAGLNGGGSGSGGSNFQGSPGIINLVPIGGPGKNTTAVTVAVLDTGVDKDHPDLLGQVVVNKAFGQPDPSDQVGHGTHVAGIIAAQSNSFGCLGAAPGARIWNYCVLGPSGGTAGDIIAALDDIAKNASEVQVANMSLGGPTSATLNAAVDRLVDLGVVCCVAAGNDTADAKDYSPASAAKAITVAALCDTDGKAGGLGKPSQGGDKDDAFADFSNYGAVVDVIAPGVDIYSCLPGGTYDFKSGTSMACPYVAGLCALIRAPKQAQSGSTPGTIINLNPITGKPLFPGAPKANPLPLTPAQVEKTLLDNATEFIPGLGTNNDASRKYPLVNGSFL